MESTVITETVVKTASGLAVAAACGLATWLRSVHKKQATAGFKHTALQDRVAHIEGDLKERVAVVHQHLEKSVAVIERRLDDSEDHDKRIAVIESVVVALKDLPIIAAKLDVLVESTMRRIELIEQHVFTKHNHQ